MATINQIDLRIQTGNRSGAGTDGHIYFGIGGREFRVDNPNSDDLGFNTTVVFTFSANGNTSDQPDNNPASQYVLKTEDLGKFPKYIRFEPENANDNWNIEEINVVVNPGVSQIKYNALGGNNHVWLGTRNGKIVYIP